MGGGGGERELVVAENQEITVRQQYRSRRYFAVITNDCCPSALARFVIGVASQTEVRLPSDSFAIGTQPKFERSSADDNAPIHSLHQVVDCRKLLLPSTQ
jgi:hypothetical protein